MPESPAVAQRYGKGHHPNSLAALKKYGFQPGQSGNPKGPPPKDVTLTSLAKKLLEEVPEIEVKGVTNKRTWRELLVEGWLLKCLQKPELFFELLNRIDGRVASQPLIDMRSQTVNILDEATAAKLKDFARRLLEERGIEVEADYARLGPDRDNLPPAARITAKGTRTKR